MSATEIAVGVPLSGRFADEWAALDLAASCEPNTSLEWTRALAAAHFEPTDDFLTIAQRAAGRLVAIVPMVLRRERALGPLTVDTIRLVCDLSTAHSDVLHVCGIDEVASGVMAALAQAPWHWDVLRVGNLLEDGPLSRQLAEAVRASGFGCRVRREQPSYFHELDASFERYLAGRSAKFRNYLRRKTRDLQKLGRVEIRRAGQDVAVEQAYQDLLLVEERSWKHAHGTAISAVPRQREFYRRLCEGMARCRRLHLQLLYLDGRPVAYDLGVTSSNRFWYLKTSFDERLRSASPSTVLRARLIETLIAEGCRGLDFPAEPYRWEAQWASELRWHTSLIVFNRSLRGRVLRATLAARARVRPAREPPGVHYADPRA